ncbi:MAG: hypothetical protein KIS83_02165 [Rubrivivax sp.]|nr:hypothetical protein [Rubrivivax sp.]
MKADVDRGPRRVVQSRLAVLSAKIRALIDAARAAPSAEAAPMLRRLALAMHAQQAVDEQVLLPALAELSEDPHAATTVRQRCELLRDLIGLVGEPALAPVSRQHMLCVLEGVWMLHEDMLADALARHAALLPWRLLQDDIEVVLARCEAALGGEPLSGEPGAGDGGGAVH